MRLMRGRSRNSSAGRISCHGASTAGTLVKKRCPPMSKRQPSRSAVRLMPPTIASPSSTVTGTLRWTSCYAAVSPAGPAPMATMFGGFFTRLRRSVSRSGVVRLRSRYLRAARRAADRPGLVSRR